MTDTANTATIQWEDPPADRRGSRGYHWFWDALKENPGKWAKYPGKSYITQKPDGYKVATRTAEDGTKSSWVMYVGDEVGASDNGEA